MNKSPIQIFTQYFRKLHSQIPLTFSINDLHKFFTQNIKTISLDDFNCIFDDLTKDKNQFNQQQALQIYFIFERQSKKVFSRLQPPIGVFLFQSLIKVNQSTENQHVTSLNLDSSKHINQHKININGSFSQILSQDYLKKLINMGANGLINEKQQQKIQKYYYNHWVQTNQQGLTFCQTQRRQVQLLKSIWGFDFKKAFEIAQQIYEYLQSDISQEQRCNYAQISSLIPGLQNLIQISRILQNNPTLKQMIQGRSKIQISFKQELLKKQGITNTNQINTLHQKYNEIMQLFTFTQQYFQILQNQIQNPYFKQVASFINFNADDKQKAQDQVQQLSKMDEIGIVERFLYAKKYYSQQNYEIFKQYVKDKSENQSHIDYILIFGNKKQSQKILQNYLDESNQIEKVALISVYLKTFSQQAKIMSTLRAQQKSFYAKFIYVYQWLLDKVDGGISRHKFDKKCLSIQIERKRKNLTKTYTFDCLNCKAQQIYSVLSKKINIDSKQPKLKGYHYFAKDNRSQIMHCIQCMIMLPKCAICLYPISVFNAYAQQMRKNSCQKKTTNKGEPINKALVWCPKCKHGGHFNHIMQWFSQQKRKCPVSNCKCRCSL